MQVVGGRVKTLLWGVALASRTYHLGNRVLDGKRRRAILRSVLFVVYLAPHSLETR